MKKKNVQDGFAALFSFNSKEEEVEHMAQMISFRFLSEVEIICEERKISRADLAKLLGTSRSHITQLYRGHRRVNMLLLARLEYALNTHFRINHTSKKPVCNIMEKTVESLLAPRMKVIAPFPQLPVMEPIENPIQPGDIFMQYEPDYIWRKVIDGKLSGFTIYYPEQYPAIFSSIPWHAERMESEMPEYIKNCWDGEIIGVHKVFHWKLPGFGFLDADKKDEFELDSSTQPATESEYLAYINQKQQLKK